VLDVFDVLDATADTEIYYVAYSCEKLIVEACRTLLTG
jgi:hypothetical protein